MSHQTATRRNDEWLDGDLAERDAYQRYIADKHARENPVAAPRMTPDEREQYIAPESPGSLDADRAANAKKRTPLFAKSNHGELLGANWKHPVMCWLHIAGHAILFFCGIGPWLVFMGIGFVFEDQDWILEWVPVLIPVIGFAVICIAVIFALLGSNINV